MLRKATHCAGRISANTRPHQLRWGDWEMGTAYGSGLLGVGQHSTFELTLLCLRM